MFSYGSDQRVVVPGMLLIFISDTVDDAVAVVAEQHRPILREDNIHRTAPDTLIVSDETNDEILIFPGGLSVFERQPNNLVASPHRTVPRTVQRDERIAFPIRRKLSPGIKR